MKRMFTALGLGGLLAGVALIRIAGPHASVRSPTVPAKSAALATPAPARPDPATPPVSAVPERAKPSVLVGDIVQSLRSGNEVDRNRVFEELLPKLMALSPHDAGLLAEEWEPGPQRDELLREVTRRWTAVDFAGAMTWLADLNNRRDARTAAQAGATEIARTDPAGAVEVAQIFNAGVGDGSLEHLVQLWTEENPQQAVDWILGRPAGATRDLLMARIAYVRAQQNPAEAAALAADFMGAGPRRDDAITAVVRQWAVRDPVAASAWVGQFPSGPLRTRSLVAINAGRRMR